MSLTVQSPALSNRGPSLSNRLRYLTHVPVRVQKKHVLRCTTLPSGALWCLVSPASLLAIKFVFSAEMVDLHRELIAVYKSDAGYSGLEHVPDDGYLVLNALYHLLGAELPLEIRCEPTRPCSFCLELVWCFLFPDFSKKFTSSGQG